MKKYFFLFLVPAFLLFILSGCLKDSKPLPCNYDACAIKAPDAEIAVVQHYLDSVGVSATQHCSGLFYKITNAGTGNAPEACQNIGVVYKGMLANGHVFDSSGTGGIALNLGSVILGWRNGIPLLKQGGKMTLYIPPTLGYGKQARYDANNNVVIPANSMLVFDVDLVAVY